MKNGNDADYLPPFTDLGPSETDVDAVDRVVAIGLPALLEWWGRVKRDTAPETYGATYTEFAGSVAYIAAGGGVSRGRVP